MWFILAEKLHRTVAELMVAMSRNEFNRWRIYLSETAKPKETEGEQAVRMLSTFGPLSPEEKDRILRSSRL